MGKDADRDPVARARRKVARAQTRYMKAVAKGEREIRNVRALADERIARAKAEYELRAGALADAERDSGKAETAGRKASASGLAALESASAEPAEVAPNGSTQAKHESPPQPLGGTGAKSKVVAKPKASGTAKPRATTRASRSRSKKV